MRRICTVSLLFLVACVAALGQNPINPVTQIRWNNLTGAGTPSATGAPCSATSGPILNGSPTPNYGQPYTDITNNKQWFCSAIGWFSVSGGGSGGVCGSNGQLQYNNGGACGGDFTTTDGNGNLKPLTVNTQGTYQGGVAFGVGNGAIPNPQPSSYVGIIGPPTGVSPQYWMQLIGTQPTANSVPYWAAPTTVNGQNQAAGAWLLLTAIAQYAQAGTFTATQTFGAGLTVNGGAFSCVSPATGCPSSGGSSTISFNGTPVTNPNINGTTPAPPSSSYANCVWDISGSNASCYVPINGGGAINGSIQTGNYNANLIGEYIRMNNGSTARTVTLPAALSAGYNVVVERATNSTASITVNPNGVTYDGVTNTLLPGESTYVWNDGAAYHSSNQIGTNRISQAMSCSDSSGSGTTQVCSTLVPATVSFPACILYSTTTPNTGGLTVNVNGVGNYTVYKWGGSATLAAGDVPAGVVVPMCLENFSITARNAWDVMVIGNAPSGGSGSVSINSSVVANPNFLNTTGLTGITWTNPTGSQVNAVLAATMNGSGGGIVTGPVTTTNNDVASYIGTNGQIQDSGVLATQLVTAASVYTSGDLVQAASASRATSDSGILAANVATAASNFTSGDVISAAGNNKTLADSGVVAANLVTAASAFTSGDLVQAAGANRTTSDSGVAVSSVATLTGTQTLTNKTLTSPVLGGTPDASGASQFKLPVASGYASLTNGEIGYDSTNHNWHAWVNGVDLIMAPLASGFVSGHCGQPTDTSSSWVIADAGSACGSGGSGTSVEVNGGAALGTANFANNTGAGEIDFTNPSGSTVNATLHNTTITLGSSTLTLGGSTTSVSGLTLSSPTLSGTPDASGATQFKLPVAASFVTAANGEVGYDTTNLNWHIWDNGADNLAAVMPTTGLTSGHVVGFLKSANSWSLQDLGAPTTVNSAAQWDVTYYSASGTTNTLSGAAVTGIVYSSGIAAPTAATSSQVLTVIGSANITNTYLANTGATVNGATCTLGSSCNVNGTNAAHTVALNEGTGTALGATSAGTANAPLLSGGASADPAYSSILYPTSLTSGGVIYGLSSTQLASSAALTSNSVLLGGGAGSAPKTVAGFTTDGTSVLELGVAGTSVGGVQLFNVTSGSIVIKPTTGALGTATITVPAATDTLVTLASTQTLTNKSIAGSEVNSGQVAAANGGTGISTASSTGIPQVSAGTWTVSTTLPNGLSVSGTFNATTSLTTGSSPPGCTAGSAGAWCLGEGSAATNVSSTAAVYASSTAHELEAATDGTSNYGILNRTQPGQVKQIGQTGALTTATLCAASAGACNVAGQYKVYIAVWGGGTACSLIGTGGVTPSLTWTDENGNVHSAVVTPMMSQTTATAVSVVTSAPTVPFETNLANEGGSGEYTVDLNGSAALQYAVAYTGCTTGTGTYNISISTVRVQ